MKCGLSRVPTVSQNCSKWGILAVSVSMKSKLSDITASADTSKHANKVNFKQTQVYHIQPHISSSSEVEDKLYAMSGFCCGIDVSLI